MNAVAAGARKPPSDAAQSSFSSIDAVLATLTNDNRRLIRLMQQRGPRTATALAKLTGRDSGGLGRSLERLHAAGIVNVEKDGHARIWVVNPGRLCIEIDLREGWERIEYVPQRRRLTCRREEEH